MQGKPQLAWQLVGLCFIWMVIVLPTRISAFSLTSLSIAPVELLALSLILLLPSKLAAVGRWLTAMLLTLGLVLKLADIGTYQTFDRAFNPIMDGHFLSDGMQFLTGVLGEAGAYALLMVLLLVVFSFGGVIFSALGKLQSLLLNIPRAFYPPASLAVAICLVLIQTPPPNATPLFSLWRNHVIAMLDSLTDLQAFAAALKQDAFADTPKTSLLDRLQGKDVMLVFVESYGRTVLDQAEYAASIAPLLERSSHQLAQQGIAARSAFLTSPTYGGISWLAHGTLMSGLWVNSQNRYDRLVQSQRQTLNKLFQQAGWRTVAVQPAHTLPWPQGEFFGYDKIYAAQDLDYHGQTFNWITMPDQYTLAALQAKELQPTHRPPVMAEIALISSHAPWTPLPKLLAWEQIGDGRIFSSANQVGDSPENVWQSTARIREQYRKAIEYSLKTLVSYVLNTANENLVLIVLGDHQPAPFVSYESPSREVLVHIISRDPKIIAAIDAWQWTPGLLPAANAPIWRMDSFRDRLVQVFSTSTAVTAN